MRIKHLFFMAVTAAFAFTACEDPIDGDNENGGADGGANFWATYQLAPKGVKSITYNGNTENYDSNGRLISTSSEYGSSSTFTYNDEGYLSKTESQYENWEGKTIKSTETYEFNNGDKFCPIPMGPASIFHIYENGLVKGLSKITFESDDDSTVVMEYNFKGNTMTATTSGGYWTQDSTGQRVYVRYDDIIIEYEGNYPRYCRGDHEFMGPITYQANGQFDTYIEGFFSWDPRFPDFVYLERTRTVNKNFKDKLLADKEVTKYWNDGEATPYNIQTMTYTYNENGDLIKDVTTNTEEGSEDTETIYEYEYDSHGNWIRMAATMTVIRPQNQRDPITWTSERTIVYY